MIQVQYVRQQSADRRQGVPHRPTPRQIAMELLLIADRLCKFRRQRRHTSQDRQQLRAVRRELRSVLRGYEL